MLEGWNQYPPMPGMQDLREVIAKKEFDIHGNVVNPQNEITIVPGATAGLFATFQALVDRGDEVIIIEPAYDSYRPAIELAGGIVVPVYIKIGATIEFPWQELRDKLNSKTRWIVINTPQNPLGLSFKKADWIQLSELIEGYSVGIISDEVYEHMVFDGAKHESVLAQVELKDKCVKISSFGKTLHCTGWKMGYVCANSEISQRIRMVFQFLAFATNSAVQKGIANFLIQHENWERDLNTFYQSKRDLFIQALKSELSPWNTVNCEGSYFQLLDYRKISKDEIQKLTSDLDVAFWILNNLGIATIPVGEFISNKPQTGLLRICFAKNDDTLIKAAQMLNAIH
jgi:methionine aminotransferase